MRGYPDLVLDTGTGKRACGDLTPP